MAYIGKTPITGNFVKLDAISVVNGQAGYTMNNGGSAFTDYENVNQFLVSLNGILQAPTDSFTVSGSTLTFASNLSTGDVIDFVIVLGNTLDIGTPSDATVTQAKTNFVSTSSSAGLQIKGDGTTDGTLQLNCSQNSHGIKLASPAHSAGQSYKLIFPAGNVTAGKFLKVDSVSGSGTTGIGTMTFGDAGGANTPYFEAYLNSNQSISSATYTKVQFNTETYDTASDYDNSSNYRYTPTTAGKYYVYTRVQVDALSASHLKSSAVEIRKNGSTYFKNFNSQADNQAQEMNLSAHGIVTMNGSSDYLEVFGYVQDESGSPRFQSTSSYPYTIFGAFKIIE